jgi:Icc-related predicted phosphoesterase
MNLLIIIRNIILNKKNKMECFFVSDLHGITERYEKLFKLISENTPDIVFIGGDLLPSFTYKLVNDKISDEFINDYFVKSLISIKEILKERYPYVLVILGNDDIKIEEEKLLKAEESGVIKYINFKKVLIENINIYGYSYVPPTPFLLKDWEKYDVSRFVDLGCVSPEEGFRSVEVEESEVKFSTIKDDIKKLVEEEDLSNAVFLFHSPPYKTKLDRLANDGKFIDYVPLDNYAGSIAIKKFIEDKQPLLTLHGHIHESTRITGNWKDKIGRTHCFNASHDGNELSVIKFNTDNIEDAVRLLI